MKRISILGIIAILVLVASVIDRFPEEWTAFRQGWEDGSQAAFTEADTGQPTMHSMGYKRIWLKVHRTGPEAECDSIMNVQEHRRVPYEITTVETFVRPGTGYRMAYMAIGFVALLTVLAMLYGFWCLIRLLVDLSHRRVLTRKNVWRMRCVAYSFALFTVLEFLMMQAEGLLSDQILLPGYEVTGLAEYSPNCFSAVMLLLFAEIFAHGVKLQEDQDLTI